MEENALDYRSILEKCGVDRDSAQHVIKNIANLEEFYDSADLVRIYNYCLLNIKNPTVLMQVIKYTDAYRSASTLSILLDILLLKVGADSIDSENLVNIRVLAAKAIANYKDNSTLGTLLYCLNNKSEHYKVRLACADALGRIGDKYAVPSLIDVVEDENEKSVYLKESVTFALGMIGDTSAIDPLISILESKQGFLDKFTFLKEKIVEALGKLNINNKKVIKALKRSLMDSSPIVRINAIEAIMNSSDENAYEIIKPSLFDEDDEVKKNALIALYNLRGKEVLDEVINSKEYCQLLKDEAQEIYTDYEDYEDFE